MTGYTEKQNGARWRLITVDEVRQWLVESEGLQRGYEEVRHGKPIDPDAYAENFRHAVWYERGRQYAVALAVAEGKLAPWEQRHRPPVPLIMFIRQALRDA